MWLLKKKSVKVTSKEPKRYPGQHDDLKQWMNDQINYYQERGYGTWSFFSPYCANYFPSLIAVGISWNEQTKKVYREMKKECPLLVMKARQNFPDSIYSYARYGDYEDYDPQHDYKVMP